MYILLLTNKAIETRINAGVIDGQIVTSHHGKTLKPQPHPRRPIHGAERLKRIYFPIATAEKHRR